MNSQPNNDNQLGLPGRKWYKTPGGVVFLIFVFLVIGVGLFFMGLVGYYTWQVKYGDPAKLAQGFQEEKKFMSVNPLLGKKKPETGLVVIKDMTKYVRSYSPVLGDKNAPVTIFAFIDFECPYSRQAYGDFKKVIEKYSPIVRVVFKYLPLESIHPNAYLSANAAACANQEGKFWPYYDLLFQKQDLSVESLNSYAGLLNLNANKFNLCLTSEQFIDQVNQDVQDAVELEVSGTPTYFVNGKKVEGVTSESDWNNLILNSLKK